MFRLPSHRIRRRRGATLIEVALTMGILLNLVFGGVEFGYYFFVKNTLVGAAREGVRAAICAGATNTTVNTAVAAQMSAAGLSNSGYTVTTVPTDISTSSAGSSITVTVSCTWGTAGRGFRPLALIGAGKTVTASAVMRDEY
jgi:Flp pilus assembly protein TadG